jgi:hypothetical protein
MAHYRGTGWTPPQLEQLNQADLACSVSFQING